MGDAMIINDSRINLTARVRELLRSEARLYPNKFTSCGDLANWLGVRKDCLRVILHRLERLGLVERKVLSVEPYRVGWRV